MTTQQSSIGATRLDPETRETLMVEARMLAAKAYPECMGSMPDGSPMPNVPRRAILGGHYDRGSLVLGPFADLLEKLDLVTMPPDTQGERQ